MQRIEYVQRRLDAWADWMAMQSDKGVRGVVISSIYKGRERVACANSDGLAPRLSALVANIEAQQIDELLTRMRAVDADAQKALIQIHWKGRRDSVGYNARRMGVSRSAMYARLARGDHLLDRWLRELAGANFTEKTVAA